MIQRIREADPDPKPRTYLVPEPLVRALKRCTPRFRQKAYRQKWFERALYVCWIGVAKGRWPRPEEKTVRPLGCRAPLSAVLLRRLMGRNYTVVLRTLAEGRILVVHDRRYRPAQGGEKGSCRRYRVPWKYLDSTSEMLVEITDRPLLREIETHDRAIRRQVKAREREEGCGRRIANRSAHESIRSSVTFRNQPRLQMRFAASDGARISTDDYTGRVYHELVNLPGSAKSKLLAPDGASVIHWDWRSHHIWLAARMADSRELMERLHSGDIYQEAADWAQNVDPQSDASREAMKENALRLLHSPYRDRNDNAFSDYLRTVVPGFVEKLENVRTERGPRNFSKALFADEREIRKFVLGNLASRGVDWFLDEHDGGMIRLRDLDKLREVLRRTNKRYFRGLCRAKLSSSGAEIKRSRLLCDLSSLSKKRIGDRTFVSARCYLVTGDPAQH